MSWEIREGDCCALMAAMPEASVDAIVCDPPYGLEFMGKEWDSLGGRQRAYQPRDEGHANSGILPMYGRGGTSEDRDRFKRRANHAAQEWHERWAREALRVLKPGGFLLAFGGTRTYHRLVCAVEHAGFEIRDRVLSLGGELGSELDWIYGSGFPKSLDVSKAIDKAAGAERKIVGEKPDRWTGAGGVLNFATDRPQATVPITAGAATPEAERWSGFGTALKPAHEPIVVARKPLAGTVAGNVLAHGTGALNIDGCRIESGEDHREKCESVVGLDSNRNGVAYGEWTGERESSWTPLGRWPANVVLSHSEGCVLVLWRRSVEAKRLRRVRRANGTDKIEVIYFVKAGDDGPIKLGRTRAELVQRRLANLQIASHVELRLLGTLESDSTGERELHRRMAHLRIRGEWFADTPELRDVLIRRPGWVRGSNLAPGGRQHDSKAADLQGEVIT